MEMPKNCDFCRIMMLEDTNCLPELFCGCPIVFKAHPQGVGHRPDYCPLIEVPKHGRLIDADALVTASHYDDHDVCVVDLDDIISASTIIPAEEGE